MSQYYQGVKFNLCRVYKYMTVLRACKCTRVTVVTGSDEDKVGKRTRQWKKQPTPLFAYTMACTNTSCNLTQ